jgi:hypothetical protein
MSRHELMWDGTIKRYYDDFVDNFAYYECVGCGAEGELLMSLTHKKNCSVVKKWNKECQIEKRKSKLRKQALAKLTRAEKLALGL